MGEFVTRANCNKDEFQFAPTAHANILTPCPWCFLCIYMYICERPKNTRVGANCNSPSYMGEFEMWVNCNKANCNMGEFHHILRCASSRTLPLRHTQKNLMPISMINVQWLMFFNDQWLMITDPCSPLTLHFSLLTFHSSLFTLHSSLPSPLPLLFSFLTTTLLDLYIKNVVLLHRI